MIPKMELASDGYRLAIGSRVDQAEVVHDFDNLMTTFQQTGDVAWDGMINADDFRFLRRSLGTGVAHTDLDLDLDGIVDLRDLEFLEDLIPHKTPGDTNLDGRVNFADFLVLSKFFGRSTGLWSRGDFDSSGQVEFTDFLILARNFEKDPSQNPQTVPEPLSGSMLLLGACLLVSAARAGRPLIVRRASRSAHVSDHSRGIAS